MEQSDHLRVIAELDALSDQITALMQRFESTGFTAVMKDDYVELHALQNRLIEQRSHHSSAVSAASLPREIPSARQ